MADKTTKWILELVDQVTAPLKGIESEAKLVTDIGIDLGNSFEKAGQEANDSGIIYTKLGQKLHEQRKEAERSAQELLELGNAADKSKRDLDTLGKEASDTGLDVRNLGEDVELTEKEIKDFTDSFQDLLAGLQTGNIPQIGAGFKGIADNIGTMTKSSLAFIATPLGATLAGLAVIGLVATDFVRYNEAAREANTLTAQMTQLNGEAVSTTRVRGKVLEEVFGQDFKDTLEIAKNNVKAFEITYDEALDNIGHALVRGANVNDEYLDSMREYPRMFANAGFTMQEFQRVIDAGFDLGMYSDKLPDAIKELDLSLKEQTQSARDALENAFGKKFTDELFQNIRNGSTTTKEALQLIAEETKNVGVNNQEAAALTADLFRGAGEDAGGYIEILSAVNGALSDQEIALSGVEAQLNLVYEATEKYREAQQEALESDTYAAFAQEMELFWMDIKTWYYEAIIWAQDWFNATTKFYVQMIAAVVEVPKQIKAVFINITEDLQLLLGTFASAGDVIGNFLSGNWDEARKGFTDFKKDLKEDISNLTRDVVLAPADIAKGVVDAYKAAGKDVDAYRDTMAYYGKQSSSASAKNITDAVNGENDPAKDKAPEAKKEGAGSGSGSGRSITMTLNFVQNFYDTKKDDVEQIASDVVRMINDKMRDAVITLN